MMTEPQNVPPDMLLRRILRVADLLTVQREPTDFTEDDTTKAVSEENLNREEEISQKTTESDSDIE